MTKANKTATMIGLDISPSSIKMVELSREPKDKGYVLEQYAIEPLPKGAIGDYKNIDDLFAVSETIRTAWKRLGTQNTNVRLALPADVVITKKIVLPRGASDDGLESEVQIEANQYIPFALDEVYMDFTVMGTAPGNADEIEVLLAATRKPNVDDRVAAVLGEGLQVIAVDLESQATQTSLAQICRQIPGDVVDQCVALVHIGSDVTTLTVVRNGESIYNRDMQIGGDQLTQQIQSKYGLSEEEAEFAKINGGLPVDYGRDVLSPFLEELVMGVARALQFFYTCTVYNEVHHIVLIGRTALLPGLKEAVATRTQVSILVESPIDDMKVSRQIGSISQLLLDAPALMIACGLAMRGLDQSTGIPINLLPHRTPPTALQIERGLTSKDAIVRRRFARRTDFTPEPKQIERGLTDKDEIVRLNFASRTDFTPTPKQIERGLADVSFLVRSEFVNSGPIRELLSYIRTNSHSHLRVGLSPKCRASWGVEESDLPPIPDSQTIQLLMRVLLGPTEFEKFEKGSQSRFRIDLEESKLEAQLFHMNGQLGASIHSITKKNTLVECRILARTCFSISDSAITKAADAIPYLKHIQLFYKDESQRAQAEKLLMDIETDANPSSAEAVPSAKNMPENVDKIAEAESFLNFGRTEQAREVLEEVLREGDVTQRSRAQELLQKMQAVATPPTAEAEHSPKGEAEEVDPIAEAELFLHFGRTEQAREILEEALRKGDETVRSKAQELLNKMRSEATPPTSEVKQSLKSETYHEIATKIDLAQAYLEMGDVEGTVDIVQEIRAELAAIQTDLFSSIGETARVPRKETFLDLMIKLDLARAYLEMGDTAGTIELLKESQGLLAQIQAEPSTVPVNQIQAESFKAQDVMKQNPILKQVWEDLETKSDKASEAIEQDREHTFITGLLAFLVKNNGSDLHLRAGLPPMMRVHGEVQRINLPVMENHDIQNMVRDLLGESGFHKFESGIQSLFAVEIEDLAEFRVQLARTNGLLAATIRQVPSRILTLDDLKAPVLLRNATEFPRGLILINGIVGSGWATTMAAMRHEILVRDDCHVLTLGKGELTNHGSVKGVHTSILVGAGMDIETYDEALKCAGNMDPDCIFIADRLDSLSASEIRIVLDLARLGHLVFANVAALSTTDALRQIIGALDYRDREFAQHQLAYVLRASICQRLIKTLKDGRVACHECFVVHPGNRKAIEDFDMDMINSSLERDSNLGATSMKHAAKRLLEQRVISKQEFDRV